MKKWIVSQILLIGFVFALRAQTNVSGTITSDTSWDLGGSPYTLVGDVTIPSGVTLTIASGVEIYCHTFYYCIYVDGILLSDGVNFTNTYSNIWNMFDIDGSTNFNNCIFNNLALTVNSNNPYTNEIMNSDFIRSEFIVNSNVTGSNYITNCYFDNTVYSYIRTYIPITISGNTFESTNPIHFSSIDG